MFSFASDLIFDYTLRTVAMGSAVLGMVSGVLGCFAVLRRQSLLGDAISHAALPGIVLAFILTGSKSPMVLILGAAVAGWLGTLKIISIVRMTRIKYDSAMAIVLSVFFGLGLVLLTYVQKTPQAAQAGLDTFLFGQAAAILERDVIVMSIVGAFGVGLVLLFWNRFKILSFDPEFGKSLGLPIPLLEVLLTSLLVIAIVLGLQTVGVVLMSAMVVAPAASARQWTDRLGMMIFLSAVFGAIAGIGGAVISSSAQRLPTGPTIVICISLIFVVSLLLAPNRGLIWSWLRFRRDRKQLHLDAVLCDLYSLAMHHDNRHHAHSIAVLRTMRSDRGGGGVLKSLEELEKFGWVTHISADNWALSASGIDQAMKVAASIGKQPE